MIENELEFSCPYCGETLTLRVDTTGGRKQSFVQDCEVCCRPIHLGLSVEGGEVVQFTAERED